MSIVLHFSLSFLRVWCYVRLLQLHSYSLSHSTGLAAAQSSPTWRPASLHHRHHPAPELRNSFPNPSISFPIGSYGEELGLLTGRSFGLRTAGSELALGLPSCPAESLFFIPIAAACYSRLFSLEVGCISQDSHPPRTSTWSRTAGHEMLTTLNGVLNTSTGSPSASAHDRLR